MDIYFNPQNRATGEPTELDHVIAYVHYMRLSDYWFTHHDATFRPGVHPRQRQMYMARAEYYDRLAMRHYLTMRPHSTDLAHEAYHQHWKNDTTVPLPAVFDRRPLSLIEHIRKVNYGNA